MKRTRKQRCSECGETFRTTEVGRTVCQNCDGSFDNSTQLEAESEAIRLANASISKEPQSVDPRTGLPSEPGKPGPSTASAPPKKKTRSNAKS